MNGLEIKCDEKVLGKIVGYEENEDGLEVVFNPTDEFYKMKKEVEKSTRKAGKIKGKI